MSDKLEKALAEAKTELVPKGERDWDAIDAKLFAQIEEDARAIRAEGAKGESLRVARLKGAPDSRTWGFVAGGLAAAAAFALFVGHKPATAPIEVTETASAPAKASSLVQRKGTGEVLVAGVAVPAGATPDVRAGDAIETRAATAFFERATPSGTRAVAWEVEESSRAVVTKSMGSLVVSLERGAVEAQVTPVASGEAFAVDVPGADGHVVRVAVHGTHLRVSRVEAVDGAHRVRLVVDLSEGVVSIGAPPRSGSTYGALVMAPAHVEMDTADPSSLVVSHVPSDVRAPVDLAAALGGPAAVAALPAPVAARDPQPQPAAVSPSPAAQAPRPAPGPRVQEVDPNAEQTVAAAVKACMAGRTQPADGQVTVTVSSTLELRVGANGFVDLATFNPPLPADAQQCAANAIYKTRFPASGAVRVQLTF